MIGRFRHLVVEGPIGVGKTTLAHRLAQRMGGEIILENADDNPFLPRFYENPRRYALPAQLFFLISRVDQARSHLQGDFFGPAGAQASVADFMLEKDLLFAQLTLDEAEFKLYRQLYDGLAPQAHAPDLVIYLQAPTAILQDRIRHRGRTAERHLTDAYLNDLSRAYNHFFYHYQAAPLLTVNSEHLNFAEKEADFALLVQRIEDMRGMREFFNLGA